MVWLTVVRSLFRPGASLSLLLCLFAASIGFAQSSDTGAISGEVTDPAGAVVPDAQIKAINLGTGATRTAVSGRSGSYTVPLLPPGEYRVEISKAGFRSVGYPSITVVVTETQTLNAKLEVGAVSD